MNEAFCKTLGNICEKKEASLQKVPRTQVVITSHGNLTSTIELEAGAEGPRMGTDLRAISLQRESLERCRMGTSDPPECSWTRRCGLEGTVPKGVPLHCRDVRGQSPSAGLRG